MWNLEEEFPALVADAATNPDSAHLLQLLAKVDRVSNESKEKQEDGTAFERS